MHPSLVGINVYKQSKWLFNPPCNLFVFNYLNLLLFVEHIKILILKEFDRKETNNFTFSLLISLNDKNYLSLLLKNKPQKTKLLELPINIQKSQNILKVIEYLTFFNCCIFKNQDYTQRKYY